MISVTPTGSLPAASPVPPLPEPELPESEPQAEARSARETMPQPATTARVPRPEKEWICM